MSRAAWQPAQRSGLPCVSITRCASLVLRAGLRRDGCSCTAPPLALHPPAVYQAGRVGAARQEQWWAAGGGQGIIKAQLQAQAQAHKHQQAGAAAAKRHRAADVARDKENAR